MKASTLLFGTLAALIVALPIASADAADRPHRKRSDATATTVTDANGTKSKRSWSGSKKPTTATVTKPVVSKPVVTPAPARPVVSKPSHPAIVTHRADTYPSNNRAGAWNIIRGVNRIDNSNDDQFSHHRRHKKHWPWRNW